MVIVNVNIHHIIAKTVKIQTSHIFLQIQASDMVCMYNIQ